MRPAAIGLLVALLGGMACGSPTAPTQVFGPVTIGETFAGTVQVLGSQFYSFDARQGGPVGLMFGSLTPSGTDTPLHVPMAIGIGVPQGTGCLVPVDVSISIGLNYQVTNTLSAGSYCVSISDVGNLAGAADFAIRIVQFPAETEPGDSGTSVFRSDLTVGGAASRTFPATKAGTVVIRLDTLGPPDGVEATLGIGLPKSDGSGQCNVTTAIVASAPAEISADVAAGIYCVKIADAGQFTETVTFSISIIKP